MSKGTRKAETPREPASGSVRANTIPASAAMTARRGPDPAIHHQQRAAFRPQVENLAEAGPATDLARGRQRAVQDQMLFAMQQAAGGQPQSGIVAPIGILAQHRGEGGRDPQLLFIDIAQLLGVQRVAAEAVPSA